MDDGHKMTYDEAATLLSCSGVMSFDEALSKLKEIVITTRKNLEDAFSEINKQINYIVSRIKELYMAEIEIIEKEEHDTPYIPKYKRIFPDRRLRFPHSRSRCQNDPDHWKFLSKNRIFSYFFISNCVIMYNRESLIKTAKQNT